MIMITRWCFASERKCIWEQGNAITLTHLFSLVCTFDFHYQITSSHLPLTTTAFNRTMYLVCMKQGNVFFSRAVSPQLFFKANESARLKEKSFIQHVFCYLILLSGYCISVGTDLFRCCVVASRKNELSNGKIAQVTSNTSYFLRIGSHIYPLQSSGMKIKRFNL